MFSIPKYKDEMPKQQVEQRRLINQEKNVLNYPHSTTHVQSIHALPCTRLRRQHRSVLVITRTYSVQTSPYCVRSVGTVLPSLARGRSRSRTARLILVDRQRRSISYARTVRATCRSWQEQPGSTTNNGLSSPIHAVT
jgi:hypothetical protein